MRFEFVLVAAVSVMPLNSAVCQAADIWGLKEGSPDLKSAGPLAFGPEDILLVGDTKAATVFAIRTDDKVGDRTKVELNIPGLNEKLAESLGTSAQEIKVQDMAVNPLSGNVYFSIAIGNDDATKPALVRVQADGEVSKLPLDNIEYSKVELPDAPEDQVVGEGRRRRNLRNESITDLAYVDGKVLVSGLSSKPSPSSVREITFPFFQADPGISLEIYHGAHGRYEDYAPVRTFVPFNIGGEPTVLAGFVCTPLVKFPISSLTSGSKVRGTTVAELGNRNRPLDMIVYEKNGKNFLLLANSARGVMKISTERIDRPDGITEKVAGGGTSGLAYETIGALKGVVQLDRLNDEKAVVLVQSDNGSQDLLTVPLP